MIEEIYNYFTIEILYYWVNLGVLPFWLILIFFPYSNFSKYLVTSIFPILILGGSYIFVLYKSSKKEQSKSLADLKSLALVDLINT